MCFLRWFVQLSLLSLLSLPTNIYAAEATLRRRLRQESKHPQRQNNRHEEFNGRLGFHDERPRKNGRPRYTAHRPKLQDRLLKDPSLRAKLKKFREHKQAQQAKGNDDDGHQSNPAFMDKMREFRNNPQNKRAKEAMLSGGEPYVMGDPSTLQGLAEGFAEDVDIKIGEDIPVMQSIVEHMEQGDLESMFMENEVSFLDSGSLPLPSADKQRVFLDFNNGGNYTAIVNGVMFELPAHVYTLEEQMTILERIRKDYEQFNVEITADAGITNMESPEDDIDAMSLDGEYSTIMFNVDIIPIEIGIVRGRITGLSVLFGLADGIDFLNLVRSDTARVNANFWELLVVLDPSGKLFSSLTEIGINSSDDVEKVLSEAIVGQSANTGAHELGHNLGFRHHDSIGAPGDGISPSLSRLSFIPKYTGQRNATETLLHTMASGASVGLSLAGGAFRDSFFSERSAIKMTLNEAKGEIISEEEAKEGIIELPQLEIPNTILQGKNAGTETIETNTLVITGRIEDFTEVDRYRVTLEEGTFLTAEVISLAVFGFNDTQSVITRLGLFREAEDGTLFEIANNAQTFEPFDPLLIDIPITETGTYVVAVTSQDRLYPFFGIYYPALYEPLPSNSTLRFGDYWLLLYSLDHEVAAGAEEQNGDSRQPLETTPYYHTTSELPSEPSVKKRHTRVNKKSTPTPDLEGTPKKVAQNKHVHGRSSEHTNRAHT